jgi:hypothetical protein
MIKKASLLIVALVCTIVVFAQKIPIGSWQSHFSYLTANTVEYLNGKVFVGSHHLVSYSFANQEFTTYSKVNGMSDVKVKLMRYDATTGFSIIIYENSNIDLMSGETFFNIPDIKNLNTTGSKKINNVYFKNKLMYLATDFGIVVLNPIKKEIKETYILQEASNVLNIKDMTTHNNYFYAATSNGIYKANENNAALQNFSSWQLVNNTPVDFILNFKDSLYTASSKVIYTLNNNLLNTIYTSTSNIIKLRAGSEQFYICENDDTKRGITFFNSLGIKQDEANSINPLDVVEISPTEIWEADGWYGMVKLNNRKEKQQFNPNGIFTNSVYNVKVINNNLYALAGNITDWTFTYNRQGFSQLTPNGDWLYFNQFVNTPALDTITDLVDLEVDKRNNYVYVASFFGGLLEFHPDKTVTVFKNNGFVQPFGGTYRITNLVLDKKNNLWMSNYGADAPLVVKKADGSWQKFNIPNATGVNTASDIAIDDANQKWLVAPRGIGVFVFNDNGTIDNKNDDKTKFIQKGVGLGNLPTNFVNCVVKDKNGKIWIGTADGIAIINCPESIMNSGGCDAELKVVKYDLDAGLLFKQENVTTIAVDGANNKWIGTNNGVWLISDDAEKILFRFTKDNSPLPSNDINKIVVNPETGIVYIATDIGLVSFRGNATDGENTNDNLLVFPNPVQSDYTGTIAIKGLVENADVKITDVAGNLVYKTTSNGGTATWDGKTLDGQKAATGVA